MFTLDFLYFALFLKKFKVIITSTEDSFKHHQPRVDLNKLKEQVEAERLEDKKQDDTDENVTGVVADQSTVELLSMLSGV